MLHDEGDSLHPPVVRQDLKQIHFGLCKWLKAIFKVTFEDKGPTFAIGKQEDAHSCGICVINSIEHELFGTALFTHNSRNILRIRYFTEVVKFLLKEVRTYLTRGNELTLTSAVAICRDRPPTQPNWRQDRHSARPDGLGNTGGGGYGY